jgi:nucleotide-binding universal stress UspA family protein
MQFAGKGGLDMTRKGQILPKAIAGENEPRFRLDLGPRGRASSREAVLVALDGTPGAERALPWAAMLARRWNVPLRLVHVRNPVEDTGSADVWLSENGQGLSVHSKMGAYLRRLAEQVGPAYGVTTTYQAVRGTSVPKTLQSLCEAGARALVMARTKRSLMSRFWWGSVSDRVIGRLASPLLLIPERAGGLEWDVPRGGFSRLLVHFDAAASAGKVVALAAELAKAGADCHLLRVLPLTSVFGTGRGGPDQAFDMRNQAWFKLLQAKERLEARGILARTRLVYDGQTAGAAILEQARVMQAEVIVLPGRPHLLPRWLRDNVTEYVVRHAATPTLIVPAESSVDGLAIREKERERNDVDLHSDETLPTFAAHAAEN